MSYDLVESRIGKVLTQYRESPKLLFMMRTYLNAIEKVACHIENLPEKFDIETATGDQLTLLGERMGFPRCHCVCDVQPVFGFECDDQFSIQPVSGFCDNSVTWVTCDEFGIGEICINDDEVYRTFLRVRTYQIAKRFDVVSLNEAVKVFFGDQAKILDHGHGRVVVAPNRELTGPEIALLQLYQRVLPVVIGVKTVFHFDTVRVFGFGEGYGGFCELLTVENDEYLRTNKTFGFQCEEPDESIGGFCEHWADEATIVTENGDALIDENGDSLIATNLVEDASWQCIVNPPWMCEIDVNTCNN